MLYREQSSSSTVMTSSGKTTVTKTTVTKTTDDSLFTETTTTSVEQHVNSSDVELAEDGGPAPAAVQ